MSSILIVIGNFIQKMCNKQTNKNYSTKTAFSPNKWGDYNFIWAVLYALDNGNPPIYITTASH